MCAYSLQITYLKSVIYSFPFANDQFGLFDLSAVFGHILSAYVNRQKTKDTVSNVVLNSKILHKVRIHLIRPLLMPVVMYRSTRTQNICPNGKGKY